MEAVVRVVTLTGTRLDSHKNDTTEDRVYHDQSKMGELSSLNGKKPFRGAAGTCH